MKLCIDVGHGGSASGAVGACSQEKNLTLIISKLLRDKLVPIGLEVILTREDDRYLELQERCDIAKQAGCDLFLSVHCNSFSNAQTTGTETFYFAGDNRGMAFATAVNNAALSVNKNNNRGVKTADFYVLKYTSMTAILLECGFISNPQEEQMLNSPKWQNDFTTSVASAIAQFCGINMQPQPIQLPVPSGANITKLLVGYNEYLPEQDRFIMHLSPGCYISFQADGIWCCNNGNWKQIGYYEYLPEQSRRIIHFTPESYISLGPDGIMITDKGNYQQIV